MSVPDSQSSATVTDLSVQRGVWLESALDEVRRDLEEDRFASALGHFREALGLSRGLPLLKARVDQQAKLHSQELLPQNWRIADTILREAAATEPLLSPDLDLLEKVKQARHNELIEVAIYKVDRLEADGKINEARQSSADLLTVYPDEIRIKERLRAFDHPELAGPPELVVKIPATELQAAVELKLEKAHLKANAEINPEINPGAEAKTLPQAWPTKVLIARSSWNAAKNFFALTATVAMLSLAALLLWQHFAKGQSAQRHTEILSVRQQDRADPPQHSSPVQAGTSVFQDVPVPPSDQDSILQTVRAYSQTNGRPIAGDMVDEVDIEGKQAKVRFRPKEKGSTVRLTFTLVRQGGGWKVQKVE